MNGRSGKILICILCGALLLIAGCATPAPSGGVPTPTSVGAAPAPQAGAADLGTVVSLLQTLSGQVSLVAENTRPEAKDLETGNIVLLDNPGNPIANGASVVALPKGKCDIAIYGQTVNLYITLEEEKEIDKGRERNYRNRQTCIDDPMCRKTVQLDSEFSFLYIEYKPYDPRYTLSQVTLAYRCQPI